MRRSAFEYVYADDIEASASPRAAAEPRVSIVTGYHCYDAASRLANPFGMVSQLGRVRGDGERASFTGVFNGRMYRITVEPDHIGGTEA